MSNAKNGCRTQKLGMFEKWSSRADWAFLKNLRLFDWNMAGLDQCYAPVICNTAPPPPTWAGDSGANVQGSGLLSSSAASGKCRACGRVDFSDQFRKIIVRYKRIGYNINIMRQSACLVFNPITVSNFASLFNCTPVGRASDSMMAPT